MEDIKQEVVEKNEVKEEEQKKPNKNKKLMYGILAAIVIIAAGIGIYAFNDQQQKQKILDSIQVTFIESPVIEYGEKDFDLNTLIKDKTDEIAKHTELDTTKLGKQTVVYRVEKEGQTKEFSLETEVKDTKGPEITFKEDAVTLEYGAEFDVAGNIESVEDPVDGDVPYAETAGEKNYYIVEESVDTSIAGEYTITVKAKDKNGNESEKTFSVNVAEEYVAPQAPANNGGGYSQPNYQQPANGGNSSGGGISGGGGNSPTPAPSCDTTPQGLSYDEAVLSGESEALNPNGPNYMRTPFVIAIFNSCGDILGYKVTWR